MNKTFIIVAIALIGVAAAVENYDGNIRQCAQDVKEVIALYPQIRSDFDNKNITGLFEDGIQLAQIGERATTDCSFSQEELQFNLQKCVKDVNNLIGLVRRVQSDIDAKNITAVIDDAVEGIELYSALVKDCGSEAKELFDLQASEIQVEGFKPVKCFKHASAFAGSVRNLTHELRNHSLPVNTTIVDIFNVVNELPSVLHDCSIPTPAWLNNTLAVENCTFAIFDLYQTIVKIQNDIDNKDIARIIEDVQQFLQSAEEVRTRCSQNQEEDEIEEIVVINPTDLPINVTECFESADQLVIAVENLENDQYNLTLWNEVFYHLEVLLGDCGAKFIEEELEKDFPPICVEALDAFIVEAETVYELAEEIQDKRTVENAIKLSKAVAELLRDFNEVKDLCPILNAKQLEAINFEDYFVDMAKISEIINQNYQNITPHTVEECIKAAEQVSIDVKALEDSLKTANPQKITEAFFTLLDETLYDFVEKCAGQAAEDEINEFFPPACSQAVEDISVYLIQVEEYIESHGTTADIKYVIESLPGFLEDLQRVKTDCPLPTQAFQQVKKFLNNQFENVFTE